MGCLPAPFRALGCLVMSVGVAAGWLYRDRVVGAALELTGHRMRASATLGRPGTRALAAAKAGTAALARGDVDSVVLGPAETASLIGDGLDPLIRRQLDSLEVRLLDGRIEVGARVATARLPQELVGPLGPFLPARERVRVAGVVSVVRPGSGRWDVDRLDIGGVPVPRDVVSRLLGRALGVPGRHSLPVALPPGVREIRIRPSGAVLFGVGKS